MTMQHSDGSTTTFKRPSPFDALKNEYTVGDMNNPVKCGTYEFFQNMEDEAVRAAIKKG